MAGSRVDVDADKQRPPVNPVPPARPDRRSMLVERPPQAIVIEGGLFASSPRPNNIPPLVHAVAVDVGNQFPVFTDCRITVALRYQHGRVQVRAMLAPELDQITVLV